MNAKRTTQVVFAITVGIVLQGQVLAAPEEGLVAHWTFDEGRGQTARDTIGDNHATLHGATWVEGVRGKAVAFDGKAGRVDCGNSPGLDIRDQLTLSAWAKVTGTPSGKKERGEPLLVGKGVNSYAITWSKKNGAVYFYISGGHNYCKAGVEHGTWQHLAGSFDGQVMRFYVNGGLVKERMLKEETKIGPGKSALIGKAERVPVYFKGLVDEVRIYNRALSSNEVRRLYKRETALRFLGNPIVISSKTLRAEFGKTSTNTYILKSIRSLQDGTEYLVSTDDYVTNIWRVFLRANDGRGRPFEAKGAMRAPGYPKDLQTDEVILNSASIKAAKVHHSLRRDARETTLDIYWEGISLGSAPNAVDVQVTVRASDNDADLKWKIKADNRSRKYGAWLVHFPVLNFTPIGGDPSDDVLIAPHAMGRSYRDPYHCGRSFSHGLNADEGDNRWGNRPWMQFWALYQEGRDALYFATYDGEGYSKHYCVNNDMGENRLRFMLTHFPENMGLPGTDFDMPFDFHIRSYQGDWYEATQIYRQWAIRQEWCQKGPLHRRGETPEWFKEAPLVFVNYGTPESRLLSAEVNGPKYVEKFREWGIDAIFPFNSYYYNEGGKPTFIYGDRGYRPTWPSFGRVVKTLTENNIYTCPYVCTNLWTFRSQDWETAKNYQCSGPNGYRLKKEYYPGDPAQYGRDKGLAGMCWATDWWQQRMLGICKKLVEERGVKGIYLDTFGETNFRCYDTSHGHPHGGGNYTYGVARKFGLRIANELKARDPDIITTGENATEHMIDVLDGTLLHYDVWPGLLPLAKAVYGDYWLWYGRTTDAGEMKDAPAFWLVASDSLIYGIKLGRLKLASYVCEPDPDMNKGLDYFRKVLKYKMLSYQYTTLGRMLKPPKFKDPIPTVTGKVRRFTITHPALKGSIWQAPDKTMGIIITNIGETKSAYTFVMDKSHYLLPDGPVDLIGVREDGTERTVVSGRKAPLTISGEIAASDVTLLRIRVR